MESYRVRVTKDYLVFCSAHFITFDNGKCECLHGHNYRAAAELEGPLGPAHLVVDFIALKKILRAITDRLDHRMLVPTRSAIIAIEENATHVHIKSCAKQWTIPREDCALLGIENTTAERLAWWITRELHAELRRAGLPLPNRTRIDVEETFGQSAIYECTGEAGL